MIQILEQDVREILSGCIYKFGPLANAKRTLQAQTLGFNSLVDFNDIYESEYRLSHYFESEAEMIKWTSGPTTPFSHIKDLARQYLDSVKVSCFSHTAINNLMWSHYSDQHSGVCYCFDFQNKNNTPFYPEPVNWGNVIYSSLIPEIYVFQNNTTEGIFEKLLMNVVLTKSSEWTYEKEIRFFLRQENKHLTYNPNSLKAIIVGRRTPDHNIDDINTDIAIYNSSNGTSVRLLFAHRIASSYNLGINSSRDFRNNSEESFNCRIPVLTSINTPVVTENKNDD